MLEAEGIVLSKRLFIPSSRSLGGLALAFWLAAPAASLGADVGRQTAVAGNPAGSIGRPAKPVRVAPSVLIGPIYGAPKRWRLRHRLAETLREHGVRADLAPTGPAGYTLTGRLRVLAGRNGERRLVVYWTLFDRQGARFADLMQMTAVPATALAGDAASAMNGLAADAVDGVTLYLPAPSGSRVANGSPDPRPAGPMAKRAAGKPQSANKPEAALHPVVAQSATVASARRTAAPVRPAAGSWWVQIGSHRNLAESSRLWASMRARSPALLGRALGMIKRADLGRKGVFYRIHLGPYRSRGSAARFCRALKASGIGCFPAQSRPRVETKAIAGAATATASRPRVHVIPAQPAPRPAPARRIFRGLPGLD